MARIDLFNQATLKVGADGVGSLTRTIDPNGNIAIRDADQLGEVRAIELRTDQSDVVVREKEVLPASLGFDAKMAHYAANRGKVTIDEDVLSFQVDTDSLTVDSYDGRILKMVTDDGSHVRVDLNAPENRGIAVKFGRCRPAFVERKTSEVSFKLGNTDGVDALHLEATIPANGMVSYLVRLIDGEDQHHMRAELAPKLEVQNGAARPLKDVAVELKLNEVQAPMRQANRRSLAGGIASLESAPADMVAAASEGATGVKTLPVASRISIAANSKKEFLFAGPLNGTPNAEMDFIPVHIDQMLKLGITAMAGQKDGPGPEQKGTPRAVYKMEGTAEAQPAGTYELYDGADRAAVLETTAYTEKGKELEINARYAAIESKAVVSTVSRREGEPREMPAPRGTDTAPTAAPRAKRMQRDDRYQMGGSVSLSSKTQFAKDLDIEIAVGSFNQGIEDDFKAKLNGEPIQAEYQKGKNLLVIKGAKVPANGEALVEFSFTGKNRIEFNAE
jgi:hypothetical protein